MKDIKNNEINQLNKEDEKNSEIQNMNKNDPSFTKVRKSMNIRYVFCKKCYDDIPPKEVTINICECKPTIKPPKFTVKPVIRQQNYPEVIARKPTRKFTKTYYSDLGYTSSDFKKIIGELIDNVHAAMAKSNLERSKNHKLGCPCPRIGSCCCCKMSIQNISNLSTPQDINNNNTHINK